MSRVVTLLLALFVVACGPTAEVTTGPTAAPTVGTTDSPTSGPSAAPTEVSATPSPLQSATPIPLSTPSPATAAPTASASPSPWPPGAAFQVLTDFPTAGAFEISDVTVTPTGFVAVGFGGLDGDDYFGLRQGIVWTSSDGTSWSQSIDPALRNVTPERVAGLGADLYLFGLLSNCPQIFDETCTEIPEAGNAVWRSSAGGAWQRLPQLPDMQLGLIDDVVVATDRLAVFGSAGDEDLSTTVWLSSDGASWTPTRDLAGLDPISSMTAGAAGFAAFGTRYVPELEDIVLIAAYSADGLHFTSAGTPELAGTAMDDVVAGSTGFVGVGYRTSEALDLLAVALNSADGMSWTQAGNSDASFAGSGLLAVHALDQGYVALGFTPHVDDFLIQDGAAWISADGQDWLELATLSGAFTQLSASALAPNGLVVFAAEQADLDEETVSSTIHAWFAPRAALTR